MQKLQALALSLGLSPEDLLRSSLEKLLSSPEPDLDKAMNYVLEKNAELYRRLA